MPTYDESNARLTDELTGRTIDHLIRKGLEIHIVCTDGHTVVIQADDNGEIHYKRTDVSIMLPGVSMFSEVGNI